MPHQRVRATFYCSFLLLVVVARLFCQKRVSCFSMIPIQELRSKCVFFQSWKDICNTAMFLGCFDKRYVAALVDCVIHEDLDVFNVVQWVDEANMRETSGPQFTRIDCFFWQHFVNVQGFCPQCVVSTHLEFFFKTSGFAVNCINVPTLCYAVIRL